MAAGLYLRDSSCRPVWWGNLHTHSTHSDGALLPGQISDHYQEAGYDFVAIIDHFRAEYGFPLTDTRARTATFTTLLGAELHAPRTALATESSAVRPP